MEVPQHNSLSVQWAQNVNVSKIVNNFSHSTRFTKRFFYVLKSSKANQFLIQYAKLVN